MIKLKIVNVLLKKKEIFRSAYRIVEYENWVEGFIPNQVVHQDFPSIVHLLLIEQMAGFWRFDIHLESSEKFASDFFIAVMPKKLLELPIIQ